jgi:hypothetical protein
MQTIGTIGLDIAKSVFQVHGVDAAGQVVVRRLRIPDHSGHPVLHRLAPLAGKALSLPLDTAPMISRTAFCSAPAPSMLAARTGPIPSTFCRRSGVSSMVSKTFSPKPAPASSRRERPHAAYHGQTQDISRSHRTRSALMCAGISNC